MARVCIEQGCPLLTDGTRCPAHERAWQQARERRPERAVYRGDWRRRSRAARKAEPWCHRVGVDGSVCGRRTDLTLDHETGTVECRSCNSSHRGTTVPSQPGGAGGVPPSSR